MQSYEECAVLLCMVLDAAGSEVGPPAENLWKVAPPSKPVAAANANAVKLPHDRVFAYNWHGRLGLRPPRRHALWKIRRRQLSAGPLSGNEPTCRLNPWCH